jgi:iron complex outermembrane recepter protein
MLARMCLCLLLAAFVTAGFGESSGTNSEGKARLTRLSLEQLGNTEVTTVSKEPTKLNRTPAAIYVITQEDIRRSGATSIPEALRLAPGVEVSRIDSHRWSLGVRGFESNLSRSVLVLIDGRSVYTPLFAGEYWEVQDTLLEDIERIEVIRGPGGTIWGANAVNAVINIITKKASETHGVFASTGGGSLDQGFFGFRYGGGNSKNLDYRVYSKAFSRGPEFHPDLQHFDRWRTAQAGFRTDWEPRSRDTLTLQGDLYNNDAGEKVGFLTYSPPATTYLQRDAELSGGNLVGRWQRVINDGSDLQLQAYYDRTNHYEPSYGEKRDTFDIDFLHHLRLPKRQNVLWGAGGRISPSDFIQRTPAIVFNPHVTDKLYSLFVQDEIGVVKDRLWVTIGSKFLHNNYTGFELQPTARILWALNSRQSAWAAVTRAVRTPSRVEEDLQLTALAGTNPPLFARAVGDGHFTSERLIGYEAGYRALVTSNLYMDLAAFYNQYTHLLSLEPGTPFLEASPPPAHILFPLYFRNGVMGNTAGFEVAPDWRPNRWWRLQGSYSFLHLDMTRSRNSLDASTAPITEGSSPHHQLAVQSSIELPKKLEFDQAYRYVSALPAQHVRPYSTMDSQLAWRLSRFELALVGQNLLQPSHAEFAGDPGPLVGIKRAMYGKLTWRREE